MDLLFPLTLTSDGSLKIVDDEAEFKLSQGRHLLATITGERILAESFGVPIDLLYTTGIPEILTERIKMAIAQYVDVKASVFIAGFNQGVVKPVVQFSVAGSDLTVVNLPSPSGDVLGFVASL